VHYPISVTVATEQMARAWSQREADRKARAAQRAQRLLAVLPDARRLLVERYGAASVILFGSLAAGNPRDTSNVDLAVEGLPDSAYFAALSDLMTLFGSPVDLVRLEGASGTLGDRIRTEGPSAVNAGLQLPSYARRYRVRPGYPATASRPDDFAPITGSCNSPSTG
jgi:predicted nucleotidyltransferase